MGRSKLNLCRMRAKTVFNSRNERSFPGHILGPYPNARIFLSASALFSPSCFKNGNKSVSSQCG